MMDSFDIRDLITVSATSMRVCAATLNTFGHPQDSANALRYIAAAHPDEPLFVMRGRDIVAVPVIREYAHAAEAHGLVQMYVQVMQHRERFAQWQANNPDKIKLPDPWPGWPGQAQDGEPSTPTPTHPDRQERCNL